MLEDFTVDDIQDYLNSMQHLKKSTIDQRKTFLGEILDAACEDGIIKKNPAKSRRLTNPGKETSASPPYSAMITGICLKNFPPWKTHGFS